VARILELTIDSLSYSGGRGVGRADGIVVFVPDTAPGDRARVQITSEKPRFLEAKLIEILEPGPGRRDPPCPVAQRCGGCCWQHVDYSVQIAAKEKILRDSLRALEKIAPIRWKPFVPAPDEFHYRNRIQVHVEAHGAGFFAKGSRDLVVTDACLISDPKLNEKLRTLERKPGRRRVELALTLEGEVIAREGERAPEAALFGQVNTTQNEKLKALVTEAVAGRPDWLMDLYCGSGNLTIPLTEKFPQTPILAVEYSRESIARAKDLNLSQVRWLDGDVAIRLAKEKPQSGHGVIVLDPPRDGVSKTALAQVVRMRPNEIVYVSCNPTTFARDAQRLTEKGYRLRNVQGLDMFPQTEHVELVAALDFAAQD
jgi:23S rRNA (uracil1939-C5)-methyltransferase